MAEDPASPPNPQPAARQAPVNQRSAASAGSVLRRGATGLVAVLFYILLLDAAVETFLAGAPIRWVVCGVVALCVVIAALARRRLTPGMHASISLIVLLGLLALSAWRPGGAASIVILRQSSSMVFGVVTALAILLAGWSVLWLTSLPATVRAVVGALAFYGVAATIRGIAAATPYPALLHGQSAWQRLPFWLQGAFLGGLVLLPIGFLILAGAAVVGARGRSRATDALVAAASALSFAIALAGFVGHSGAADATGPAALNEAGATGPGLRPLTIAALQLPVQRALDLSHVAPAPFAAGLGNDPARIFEFVRDQIAYESYAGCLRGPRGTLLAMAGNSVDRAALLASLLEQSGQRVRYAHGRLTGDLARELVASMWMKRAAVDRPAGEASPAVTAAAEALTAGVKRDSALLGDALRKAGHPAQAGPVTLESLLAETQDHYWVQWSSNGSWTDLDASFADAKPGTVYARQTETFDELPEALFHRVDVRVRLEEYGGGKPSSREVLKHSAKAADLSGLDLALFHVEQQQPGQEGGSSLGALSSGQGAPVRSGQLKPCLVVEQQRVEGAPFWLRPPAQKSTAGFEGMLGGGEGESPVPTAVAEFVEFVFTEPGGHRETVVRELFDLVGPARRHKGEMLSPADVVAGGGSPIAEEASSALYSCHFTTGAVHAGHLVNVVASPPPAKSDPVDILAGLRRVNIAFLAVSDALLGRVTNNRGTVCRYYLDSPRVLIAGISIASTGARLSFDLRRDQARAVAAGFRKEDSFSAQVFRGVMDGTLERTLVDFFAAFTEPADVSWSPVLSTSWVFDRANASGATTALLAAGQAMPSEGVPEKARVRIEEAMAAGHVVLVPRAPVDVAGVPRYAWWQIDPRSGATTAVTDEGLHQATVELGIQKSKNGEITVVTHVRGVDTGFHSARFANAQEANQFIDMMTQRLYQTLGNQLKGIELTGDWWVLGVG